MTFKELNIVEPILKALIDKKYEIPTPIQAKAIPAALLGRDVLGTAQTGTGKTAAFAIPIIQQLSTRTKEANGRTIKALIITPTRELAIQIEESFADYAKYTDLRHCVIFGGVKQKAQTDRLRSGVDILIATPGRLLDLINQRFVELSHVNFFVLDEADRMLDMGFIHDIRRLLPLLPKERQTMFFSATMPSEIATLSSSILHNPAKVAADPVSSVVDTIDQSVYYVAKTERNGLLLRLLKRDDKKSVLVFSRTKHGADRISRTLCKAGIDCDAIHGNKSQAARQRALSDFKLGKSRVIVATDIAARGIDIVGLDLVINFDLPDVPETYVHRIGRTGRAGCLGAAVSFCTPDERPMLDEIRKLTGRKLQPVRVA
ncbi:MAG: DEAD/DEAH box helicase [Alistipes sp.]